MPTNDELKRAWQNVESKMGFEVPDAVKQSGSMEQILLYCLGVQGERIKNQDEKIKQLTEAMKLLNQKMTALMNSR